MAFLLTTGATTPLLSQHALPSIESRSLSRASGRQIDSRSWIRGRHRGRCHRAARREAAHPSGQADSRHHEKEWLQLAIRSRRPGSFRSRSHKVRLSQRPARYQKNSDHLPGDAGEKRVQAEVSEQGRGFAQACASENKSVCSRCHNEGGSTCRQSHSLTEQTRKRP